MGLERSERVRTHPTEKNNHTNKSVFSLDGRGLFMLTVDRHRHAERPRGFTVEWVTNKTDLEIVDAAIDVYLDTRAKFSLPDDFMTRATASHIRNHAVKRASQLVKKGFLEVDIQEMKKHREQIDPLRMTMYGDPPERNLFYYAEGKNFDPEELKNGFTRIFPDPDMILARIEWPLALVKFDGAFEGVGERRVAMTTRYRIVREVLELFRRTSDIPLTDSDISGINKRLRMPVWKLDRPAKSYLNLFDTTYSVLTVT